MTLNVMIVEDEALIAMDLEDLLLDAGHRVVGIADNMHRALEIAAVESIDVAIMDIDLAMDTNGIETARHLRERHDVASLFVSGRINDETRAMALEWKPVGFIGKPFQAHQITSLLAGAGRAAIS